MPSRISISIAGSLAPTSQYELASLSIQRRVNGIASAEFVLEYRTPLTSSTLFRPGQIVEIVDGQTGMGTVFKGPISRVRVRLAGAPKDTGFSQRIQITAEDFSALAKRFHVAAIFSGLTAGEIVRRIVTDHTSLGAEGVTTGGVDDGPVLEEARFDYDTAAEAFSDLARLFGWVWYIDDARVLHFKDRALVAAPFHFVLGSSRWLSMERELDIEGYANRIVLRAGMGRTDPRQETHKAKTDETDYLLEFAIAEKPRLYLDTGSGFVEVANAKIGVQGVDDAEKKTGANYDFEWFYKIEDEHIRRNRNLAALASTDKLRVDYVGLFPLIVQADNVEEQAAMAARAGTGTGIVARLEEDESIDGTELADARATGILDESDQISDTVQILTDLVGWTPGQTVYLESLPLAVAIEAYFVEAIRLRERPVLELADRPWEFQLTCVNERQLSREWEFWRRAAAAGRKFVLRENERLLIIQKHKEQISSQDALKTGIPETGNQLVSWTQDPYTVALIDDSMVGDPVGDILELA
jgi:hypothetical protein